MKKSFAYSSAVLWNKLSTNVKTSTTLRIFKMKCFKYKYLKETSDKYALEGSVNGRSMNRLHTNALQNVQQHGCQPQMN
jgi:hypothetical protein